ncbi:MAG: hypothetical protein ABFS32_20195 [Bacteroidota bacterium]
MKRINMILKALFVGIICIVILGGCSKNGEQNPRITLEFKTVKSTAKKSSNFNTLTNGISFSSGFITICEVQFQVETDDDSIKVEFDLDLITKIDFATGATSPDISDINIPAGTYHEVEVEIELQDEGDEPAVVLHGSYTDAQGTAHNLRFEYNSGETFEIEREGTITFATDESVIAQVTFDPSAWFAEVSMEQLSEATRNGDGIIVISSTQNADIFDVVADGLDLATELELSH